MNNDVMFFVRVLEMMSYAFGGAILLIFCLMVFWFWCVTKTTYSSDGRI